MEYWDFIKDGDLDELPENPQLAFIKFVRIAEPRLTERLRELEGGDETAWTLMQEAKFGFQNVVTGAARKFRIPPFDKSDLPTLANYNDRDYRQFRQDLSHYITQIMVGQAETQRDASIPLLEETRQTIRTYIFHMRAAIDAAAEVPDAKKARMHGHLDKLEKELSKRRVNILQVSLIAIAIVGAPGDLASSYDAVANLTTKILREIGKAKITDEEQRKISTDQPVALIAPRKEPELEDEIPF